MIILLVLIPALIGLLAFVIRSNTLRRVLLIVAAVIHTGLVGVSWAIRPGATLEEWLFMDAPGLLFLSITSVLFLLAAIYSVGYLTREGQGKREDFEEGIFFNNAPEAVFIGCMLLFLATMTLVCVSQHFGVLWVAIEATTLASAPLIYFHRHHRSLEAAWKYLLICSVGIAIALLGNFFMAVAASNHGSKPITLILDNLIRNAGQLHTPWLKAAFLLFLVGYGTKMGLAPLHTWLPDAHSESPSVVSALLSGALLNCAFLGILRAQQVCAAAGQAAFGQDLLIIFGLFSMGIAAVFILKQADFKRMLAYSSTEHMGILALGIGLGGTATFGAMLHAINHSMTKGMLFLVAGNIIAIYKTKATSQVRGVINLLPVSGILWVAGFLAITGSPPFGSFLSEFTILKAAIEQGRISVAIAYLAILSFIFISMASIVLRMAQGIPTSTEKTPEQQEPALAILPPIILGFFILILGFYIPPTVGNLLHEASRMLGGS